MIICDNIVNEMVRLYTIEHLTIMDIAKKLDVSYGCVQNRLKKNNVKPIKYDRKLRLNRNESFKLNKDIISYIDGLIISDGYISVTNNNYRYVQGNCLKQKQWIYDIKKYFDMIGVDSSLSIQKNHGYIISDLIRLQTKMYMQFKYFKDRWYPKGKKVIPIDIDITSQFLANWYMGDGSLTKSKNGNPNHITFHTECFEENEILEFIKRLNLQFDLNWRIGHKCGKPTIVICGKENMYKFFDIIRSYISECFKYKLGD